MVFLFLPNTRLCQKSKDLELAQARAHFINISPDYNRKVFITPENFSELLQSFGRKISWRTIFVRYIQPIPADECDVVGGLLTQFRLEHLYK